MATYALIHGAADTGWSWHLVASELFERGHEVVAPDLPCEDDSAGLAEYADAVVEAVGDRTDLVVVAHSYGGFTAPLVCERVPVDLLVLMAAMVPAPGERPGEWWANTGYARAVEERYGHDRPASEDTIAWFYHDVREDLAAEALRRGRGQSATPDEAPWPLHAWPDVPTRFLLCRDDRMFPPDFQRRVVRERLGITPDEMDGGHLPALHSPVELAARLDAYAADVSGE